MKDSIKPFLSIIFVISTLFSLVFLQMEERRLGYVILKLGREQRQVIEEKREKVMALAKFMRPQSIEKMAQNRFTLRKIQASQIIHLTGAQASQARELN